MSWVMQRELVNNYRWEIVKERWKQTEQASEAQCVFLSEVAVEISAVNLQETAMVSVIALQFDRDYW